MATVATPNGCQEGCIGSGVARQSAQLQRDGTRDDFQAVTAGAVLVDAGLGDLDGLGVTAVGVLDAPIHTERCEGSDGAPLRERHETVAVNGHLGGWQARGVFAGRR